MFTVIIETLIFVSNLSLSLCNQPNSTEGGEGDCTTNQTIWQDNPSLRCPEENAIVPIMLALYMILTNILLVNLLIAMFRWDSYTSQQHLIIWYLLITATTSESLIIFFYVCKTINEMLMLNTIQKLSVGVRFTVGTSYRNEFCEKISFQSLCIGYTLQRLCVVMVWRLLCIKFGLLSELIGLVPYGCFYLAIFFMLFWSATLFLRRCLVVYLVS